MYIVHIRLLIHSLTHTTLPLHMHKKMRPICFEAFKIVPAAPHFLYTYTSTPNNTHTYTCRDAQVQYMIESPWIPDSHATQLSILSCIHTDPVHIHTPKMQSECCFSYNCCCYCCCCFVLNSEMYLAFGFWTRPYTYTERISFSAFWLPFCSYSFTTLNYIYVNFIRIYVYQNTQYSVYICQINFRAQQTAK